MCVGGGKYLAEKLNPVFDTMEAARLTELLEGDGLSGVDALGLYPLVDAAEVEGGHFHREPTYID